MNARFIGVYWINRKDELPEDWTVCVFHIKWRSPEGIYGGLCFGKYYNGYFWERNNPKQWDKSAIDYWMPVPVLPPLLPY